MKLRIFLFCFLFSIYTTQAQIYDTSFDFNAESSRLVSVPNSPEAAAFIKYGNTPINLYHGNPNISVPIYTHQGKEISLPISLSYDASGIKVEQLATEVGLGWNFNVGGRISRIVNGMPDDYYITGGDGTNAVYKTLWDSSLNADILQYSDPSFHSSSFDTKEELIAYMYFLRKIYKNEYDTQPDYFSFNALGVSETFVIDVEEKKAFALNNPRIKITIEGASPFSSQNPISGWKVVLENGTQLFFNAAEITKSRNLNDLVDEGFYYGRNKKYNSSWLLTKIISPLGKDTYEFDYTDQGFWSNDLETANLSGVVNRLTKLASDPPSWTPANSTTLNLGYTGGQEYNINQKILNKITYNEERLVEVTLKTNRYDISGKSAIEGIDVFNIDTGNNVNDLYKSFKLNYDYFKTDSDLVVNSSTNKSNIRLKLKGVDLKDKNNVYVASYYFSYLDSYKMPSLVSSGQDYYGYYNGADGNSTLYPSHPSVPGGANRNSSFDRTKRGTLNKIFYPTGGHTEFEYEANQSSVLDPNNTESSWDFVGQFTSDITSLPTFDNTLCNKMVFISGGTQTITPHIETYELNVTSTKEYKFIVSESGTSTDGSVDGDRLDFQEYFLVKLADDVTGLVGWSDILNQDCEFTDVVEDVYNLEDDLGEYPSNTYLTLESGNYQIFMSNSTPGVAKTIDIEIQVENPIYIDVNRAGMRVKTITDFSDDNTQVLKRNFSYFNGKIISNPIYFYQSEQRSLDGPNNIVESQILTRLSVAKGTDKPHIGYSTVTEKIIDSNDEASNGYISHRFYNSDWKSYGSGVYNYSIFGQQTPNNYAVNYSLGKPNGQSIISDTEGVKSKSYNQYYHKEFYANIGIYTMNNEDNNHLFPIPKESTSGSWVLDYIPYEVFGVYGGTVIEWADSSGGIFGVTSPPDCISEYENTGEASDLCNPAMARLVRQLARATGRAGNITISQSTQYSPEGESTQSTYYDYYDGTSGTFTRAPSGTISETGSGDNPPDLLGVVNYLLKKTTTDDSNGDFYSQKYFYPENFSSEYTALKTANMVGITVQTTTFKDTDLLATKRTHFSGTTPLDIQTSKASENLEERLSFEVYDTKKNLVQARRPDGTPVTYLWGYHYRYVIAKIDNTTFSQAQAALSVSYSALQTLDDVALETEFNALRNSLTDSQITTYTYEPVIGVSTITDPTKNKIFYKYDNFQRLQYILDKDQNIIKEYKYSYKNYDEPEDETETTTDPLSVGGIEVIMDNSSFETIVQYSGSTYGVTGGSGVYTYNWSYKINYGDPSYTDTAYISLGTNYNFVLSYDTAESNNFCLGVDMTDPFTYTNQITFKCIVSSPGETDFPVYNTVNATCQIDNQ